MCAYPAWIKTCVLAYWSRKIYVDEALKSRYIYMDKLGILKSIII